MATTADNVDLSEFYRYSRPKKPPCKVGFVVSQLKPQEKKQLSAALEADKNIITASAVQTWMEKRGHECTTNAIAVHRQGRCSCAAA